MKSRGRIEVDRMPCTFLDGCLHSTGPKRVVFGVFCVVVNKMEGSPESLHRSVCCLDVAFTEHSKPFEEMMVARLVF